MSFNYRVAKKKCPITHEEFFEILEIYYDDEGNINGWVEERYSPIGGDIIELKGDLEHMMKAFDKPVIDFDELSKIK